MKEKEETVKEQPKKEPRRSFAAPAVLARSKFEEGLLSMQSKDLRAALAALEEAVKLAPENRLYQGDLKIIKRLLSEEERQSAKEIQEAFGQQDSRARRAERANHRWSATSAVSRLV
jgi:hypothetical protein